MPSSLMVFFPTFPFDRGKGCVTQATHNICTSLSMVKCSCFALGVGTHICMYQALFMHLIVTYRMVLYKESYLHPALQCLLFLPYCKLFMGRSDVFW